MCSILSFPLTSKGLHRVGDEKMKIAACEMQGHRLTMEDAHCIILDFTPTSSFFGVFDGHGAGGEWSSDWFAKNLPAFVKAKNSLKKKDIISACLEADQAFIEESTKINKPFKDTGTTAIFCIVEESKRPKNPSKPYKLIVGNIGDSRCLLLRDGGLQSLTIDHKPTNEGESKRISAAGGYVAGGRVDGVLAISRALGDHTFKDKPNIHPERQRVVAVPDIYTIDGVGGDDMVFLLCDGIYEGSSNEAAVNNLHKFIKEHPNDPALALSLLFEKQVGNSQDNMSSILIQFKDGTGYSSLSSQGENEYIPCQFQSGAEFSKAFIKFGLRYGHPTGYPEVNASSSKRKDSQKDDESVNEPKKSTKTNEKKSKKRKGKAAQPKQDVDESIDDTDEEEEEPPEVLSMPRRSSRLQLIAPPKISVTTSSSTVITSLSPAPPISSTVAISFSEKTTTTTTSISSEKKKKRAKKM